MFDESYSSLVAYARRRTDHAAADDVVAETLLVAWRRLDDLPDAPLPWLYGVARRVLANQRRGDRRRGQLNDRLRALPPVLPEPIHESGGGDADLLAALAQLSHDDQEVLRLAAWERLASREIAVVLGCSPNAAALRLSRARRKLRSAMTQIGPTRTPVTWREGDG